MGLSFRIPASFDRFTKNKKMNKLIKYIKKFSDERWNIGFMENPLDEIMNGGTPRVNWMKHEFKDRWFADPFILDVTDNEIVVLAEEFYKPIYRGRISRLIIDRRTLELKKLDVVLQLSSHLSFPFIERVGNDIFLYPENGARGGLWRYKYIEADNKIRLDAQVCYLPVEDSVITSLFGGKKMFATQQPTPNGNVMQIFEWNIDKKVFNPIAEHKFEENIARMAGDFFCYKGKIYCPTQECNHQYGHAVTIQEVENNNGKWNFKEVRRLHSVHPKLNVGTHTFNMYKGIIVTDALGFDNNWLRIILHKLHILHKVNN